MESLRKNKKEKKRAAENPFVSDAKRATRGEDLEKKTISAVTAELTELNDNAFEAYLSDVKDAYVSTATTFVRIYGEKASVTKESLEQKMSVQGLNVWNNLYGPALDQKDAEIKELKLQLAKANKTDLAKNNRLQAEHIQKLTAENQRLAEQMHTYQESGKKAGIAESQELVDSLRRTVVTEQKNLERVQSVLKTKSSSLDAAEKELAVLRARDLGVAKEEYERVCTQLKELQSARTMFQLENQRLQRVIESFEDNGAEKLAKANTLLSDYCATIRSHENTINILNGQAVDQEKLLKEINTLKEQAVDSLKLKEELDDTKLDLEAARNRLKHAAEEACSFMERMQSWLPIHNEI